MWHTEVMQEHPEAVLILSEVFLALIFVHPALCKQRHRQTVGPRCLHGLQHQEKQEIRLESGRLLIFEYQFKTCMHDVLGIGASAATQEIR